MFNLPKELQNLIYSFDNTYKLQFDNVLKLINKKFVSKFKYSKKYTHCSYCNIKVQNYTRHCYTLKHEYNSTLHGYNKYYKTIAKKILQYIKFNNININTKSQISNIFALITLDDDELYAIYNYYTNLNVSVKIVYNKLKR